MPGLNVMVMINSSAAKQAVPVLLQGNSLFHAALSIERPLLILPFLDAGILHSHKGKSVNSPGFYPPSGKQNQKSPMTPGMDVILYAKNHIFLYSTFQSPNNRKIIRTKTGSIAE